MEKKYIIAIVISFALVVGTIIGFAIFLLDEKNIDTTPPKIEILSPHSATYYNTTQVLEINATDDLSGIDKIWYNWQGDDIIYQNPIPIIFAEGLNTIHIWAEDLAGNVGYTTLKFTILIGASFYSVWDTTEPGLSSDDQITLPLELPGTYNFDIDWGDGTKSTITAWDHPNRTHTYISAGIYNININGTIIG